VPRDRRPVAGRLGDGPVQCLLARVAGEHIVLPLADVLEAVDAPAFDAPAAEGAPLPGRPRRVLPWRGRALPVHDAGLLLGAGSASAGVALVLADPDGRPMAFAADDAVDIVQVTRDDVRRVPAAASADGLVIGAVATAAGLAAVVEPAVLCQIARAAAPTPTASDDPCA
jgi:chemotaxis protein histidine kinase CheA